MNEKNLTSKLRIPRKKSDVNGFTSILNRVIRDPRLTNSEHRVLMVLISYYNKKEKIAYPSAKRIEQEANISEKYRKKIIKSLIKKHRIKRTFRPGTMNGYTFPCLPFPKNDQAEPTKKKKKPYYDNQEMRRSAGKWFVIAQDGQWLEFADSEDKIIYK